MVCSVLVDLNIMSLEDEMQVNKAIIRRKEKQQPIKEMVKNFRGDQNKQLWTLW